MRLAKGTWWRNSDIEGHTYDQGDTMDITTDTEPDGSIVS
jgi:hypothetical protein